MDLRTASTDYFRAMKIPLLKGRREELMYVITGATGQTGNEVAEKLLAKGEQVRVVGRSGKRLEPFVKKGAEAFVADITDTGALTKAFSGAKGVYAMIPPDVSAPDVLAHYQRVRRRLGRRD